jgi:hypothetical protein
LINDAHADTYERENIDGSESLVSWKSVASGSTDKVIAWSEEKKNLFDEVNYQNLNGDIPKRENENVVELTVTGMGHEEVSEIEAYVKDPSDESKKVVIGRLNVISYDPVVRNLVLVPVNGASIPSQASLGQELNKIFSPAIVTWNISTRENINVGLGSDGKLNDGSSGLLSNYTDEMRAVIRSFKKDNDIEDETYYLFFVQGGETGDKSGYMPRKKQCGFIFTSSVSSQNLAKTVAHELAHGAFRLEHTFETYPTLSKGTTDNLMDYGTGSRLHKYQWDLIHNPVAVWGLFEGDQEGASKSLLNSKYVIVHDDLSENAYASTKGNDAFTQEGINDVDSKLEPLHSADKKTYIYFAYIWFDANNINKFDELIDKGFNKAYDLIKKDLSVNNFNLLTIVNAKYDRALGDGLKTVSFREKFYPMKRLDPTCVKEMDDYLKGSSKKKFVDGLDDALRERATKLTEALKNCSLILETYGEAVAEFALSLDDDDRTYKQVTEDNGRLTDDYIDCAEFAYEVAKEKGATNIPSGGCSEQVEWFKENGIRGTDFNAIQVGDFIYWDRPANDKVYEIKYKKGFQGEEYNDIRKDADGKEIGFYLPYDHVGIVIEKLDDGRVKYINASVNRDSKTKVLRPSINAPSRPTDAAGTIWKGDATNEQNFVCWCRLLKN